MPQGSKHVTALLPLARGALLAGTNAGVFRWSGSTWFPISFPNLRQPIERLQSFGRSVTAVSSEGGFRSENGGTSWSACGQPEPGTVWYGLALEPGTAGIALAATAKGLFRSTDRCASWTPVRDGLEQGTVSAVLLHPKRESEFVAAQYGTVFRSADGGLSWRPLSGAESNAVYPATLLMVPEIPESLFALFPRRGILSIPN